MKWHFLSCRGGPLPRIGIVFLMLTFLAGPSAPGQNSKVIGWGLNENGQATPPPGLSDAVAVAAAFRNSLAVLANGKVVGWGNSTVDPPTVPPGLSNVINLVTRGGRNLVLRDDGTVVEWSYFEPDLGKTVPPGLSNVVAVAQEGVYSLALRGNGTVVSWGGSRTNVPSNLSNVIAIAAASDVSLAAKSDGRVVGWNRDGLILPTIVPPGLSNVVAVAASHFDFSMALKSDGTVVTWGNSAGGVGLVPAGLSNVVAITANGLHAMALKSDGRVVAWGPNDLGQNNVPASATNVTAISVGFGHMLAVSRSAPASWPRITQQPQSVRKLMGDATTFFVLAGASEPLSYRWQFCGQDLPNETNATFVLNEVPLAASGDYAVVVSAGGLSVRSAPAFLAVSSRPVASPVTSECVEDTDLAIKLDGFDPSSLPLAAKVISLPSSGRLFQSDRGRRGSPITSVPTLVGGDGVLIYVPSADGNGIAYDDFLFAVSNEIGDSTPAKVVIDVAPVNDPPNFLKGPNVMVPEDAGPQIIRGWATHLSAGPPDEAAQGLEFVTRDDNSALFAEPPSVGRDGTLTFTTAPNANGSATVTLQLQDNGGTSNGGVDASPLQTFSLTVAPVNDPPVAQSQSVILNEDAAIEITVSGSDVEADSLSYSVSPPSHGTLTGTSLHLIYRPAPNYFGPDRFTFLVNDGQADSSPATVSITVLPVNDPPVAIAVASSPTALSGHGGSNLLVIAKNNSFADVILDGSSSTDVEQDSLEFLWVVEGEPTPFGAGIKVTNRFELGIYQIVLRVFDGLSEATTPLVLEVTTPGEAVEMLILRVNDAALARKNRRPLVASLKSAAASFDRGNFTAGIHQLGAFQNKTRAQLRPSDETEAEALIKTAQDIVDALSRGGL